MSPIINALSDINLKTDIIRISNSIDILNNKNGFEFTEDFDGKVIMKTHNKINITIYFNLKFCCDAGGAQTRTLREVYHFIKCQIIFVIPRMKKYVCIIRRDYIILYKVPILRKISGLSVKT